MKKVAKRIVVTVLGWQVRRLRRKNSFKIIAVAGSIGKTSTKFAIADVLGQHFRVRFQRGNYNDIVTVPLVFFGLSEPSLLNPLAWLSAFLKIEKQLRSSYPYDIVLVELGPDGPGQMTNFKRYLETDIGVLTAITPEHMEFFTDLDAVASEELVLGELSKTVLANVDLCAKEYLARLKTPPLTYGLHQSADYQIVDVDFSGVGCKFAIAHKGGKFIELEHDCVAEIQLYSIGAAAALGRELGLTTTEITAGINVIKPVSGRMQRLRGVNDSIILDDTYNASPAATKAALETLYRLPAPQKIALLGNMNELGAYSPDAHRQIGELCDPEQLELVVTIGPDANKYLAAAAEQRGCLVKRFNSPYEAGQYIKTVIKSGAVILAKGSQNGVFAEEAVKQFLADPANAVQLVRQSSTWLAKKQQQFPIVT